MENRIMTEVSLKLKTPADTKTWYGASSVYTIIVDGAEVGETSNGFRRGERRVKLYAVPGDDGKPLTQNIRATLKTFPKDYERSLMNGTIRGSRLQVLNRELVMAFSRQEQAQNNLEGISVRIQQLQIEIAELK
jgi:hypothetical protein